MKLASALTRLGLLAALPTLSGLGPAYDAKAGEALGFPTFGAGKIGVNYGVKASLLMHQPANTPLPRARMRLPEMPQLQNLGHPPPCAPIPNDGLGFPLPNGIAAHDDALCQITLAYLRCLARSAQRADLPRKCCDLCQAGYPSGPVG